MSGITALVITTAMISAAMMVALAVWDGIKAGVRWIVRRLK
jgi:hypothetical protein